MTAINPNELGKFKGILEIRPAGTTGAYSRLASVRGLATNFDISNIIEIKADDTGTVFKATNQTTTIETELLEVFGRDTLALLFNGTSTDVAGVATSITGEALGTGWTVGTPIKLANKNGNNTIVSSIVIKEDGVALASGTDYTTYVGNGTNGALGYTYIVPITAQTGVITADYSYTPNDTEKFLTNNDSQELKNFEIKITATDNGKDRTITVSSATLSSTYGLSFTDIVEGGELAGAKLTFTSNKGSNTLYENQIL